MHEIFFVLFIRETSIVPTILSDPSYVAISEMELLETVLHYLQYGLKIKTNILSREKIRKHSRAELLIELDSSIRSHQEPKRISLIFIISVNWIFMSVECGYIFLSDSSNMED